MRNRLFTLLLAVGLAAIALGQGYKLSRAPKLGQELKYRLNAEFDLLGSSATMSALITEKVVATDIKGNFTVESRQSEGKLKYGDKEQPMRDTTPESAVYTALGEVIEIKSANKMGLQGRLARLNSFVVPDREIKVGDGWSHVYLGSPLTGGIGGKSNYKASALEKLGAKNALVVQLDYKESSGPAPAESSIKAWIDVETGELLKLEGQWKNVPYNVADGPVNLKVKLNRE